MKLTFQINQQTVDVMIKNVASDLNQVATKTIEHLGSYMIKAAQETTKFNHGNHFNEGITFNLIDLNYGEVKSEVYNAAGTEYSNFMEFGNDPGGGRIYPVHAKALHFFAGGQEIFAKSVAAIDPAKTGFFTDAVNQTTDQVQDVFDEEFNKLFK